MPKATTDDIAKVRAANPGTEIHLVEHPALPHDFIVHGPSRAVWNIFRQKNGNDAEKLQAEELLFEACVVWPEKGSDRDELVERYPALLGVVAGEIAEIAGVSKGATHRKL